MGKLPAILFLLGVNAMQDQKMISDKESWNDYWQSGTNNPAHVMADQQRQLLESFWKQQFDSALKNKPIKRFLDIGCGNGTVTKQFYDFNLQNKELNQQIYSLDYSRSAIKHLTKKLPLVKGISADAKALPFASNQFDAVVSQFGIEYAGLKAFEEAYRVTAGGGLFAAIVHQHSGEIAKECKNNFDALQELQDSELLLNAHTAFDAAYQIKYFSASKEIFEKADRALAVSVNKVKAILNKKSCRAADNSILKVYRDIATMYQQLESYFPNDVNQWFERTNQELSAYKGRMRSMTKSAIGKEQLKSVIQKFTHQTQKNIQISSLKNSNSGSSFGWAVTYQKVL